MLKENQFLARPWMIITMISSMILACGRDDRAATSDGSTGSDASAKYDGNDAALGCEPPLSRCKEACVQTWSDVNHCGACGNVCAPGLVCSFSICKSRCDSSLTDCDGSCVDLQIDPSHCGSCQTACEFAHAIADCQEATCTLQACDADYADCNGDPADGCEVALASFLNCGACGIVCTTVANGVSECVDSGQGFTCAITSCNSGHADCDANYANGCETNTRTSIFHCGGCGNVCTYANASAICASGICAMGACSSGYGNCDGNSTNGCETNTRTDANNCGACGNVCPTPAHGTRACTSGVCGIASCDTGYANCDSNPANGCETNTRTDVNNCGACGNVCPSRPYSSRSCTDGACGFTCFSGYADCDSDPINGCEIYTRYNVNHCGGCGNVCTYANASAICASGICAMGACSSGYGNCDGTSANGCETATSSNLSHCGSCGWACSVANGTAGCAAGSCTVASCNSGYVDCDDDPTNGCEINTRTSIFHCGGCGNACSYANASAICTGGACAISACNSGYANCDGALANGCETITSSDVTHCGSCGRACSVANGTAGCAAGSCTVSACNSGYANCDGTSANGCEINMNTDVNNCGSCGIVCPSRPYSSQSCTAGACGFTCFSGYADCDSDPANGCEIYTRYNVNHCGGCGNICPTVANSSPWCTDSTCRFSCSGWYADCDGAPANGCEINRRTDSNNCGLCGTACTAEQGCYNGSCEPRGYAFGANRTEGCSATLGSSCGTNMANFSSYSNPVTSEVLRECLGFPALPNGASVRVSFDYAASASSCFNRPYLSVVNGSTTPAVFSFDCVSSGSSWLDFTLSADQNTFELRVFSGDWCASVRITSVTQR